MPPKKLNFKFTRICSGVFFVLMVIGSAVIALVNTNHSLTSQSQDLTILVPLYGLIGLIFGFILGIIIDFINYILK